jgi:hypothetical protein
MTPESLTLSASAAASPAHLARLLSHSCMSTPPEPSASIASIISSTLIYLAFGGADVGFVLGRALSARPSSLLSRNPFLSVSNCSNTLLPHVAMAACSDCSSAGGPLAASAPFSQVSSSLGETMSEALEKTKATGDTENRKLRIERAQDRQAIEITNDMCSGLKPTMHTQHPSSQRPARRRPFPRPRRISLPQAQAWCAQPPACAAR